MRWDDDYVRYLRKRAAASNDLEKRAATGFYRGAVFGALLATGCWLLLAAAVMVLR